MYSLLRPLIFRLEPEQAHHATLSMLKLAARFGLTAPVPPRSRPTELMGLQLPNPVGLAAGLDKNGEYIDALAALGFGFIEIGTVTPRPQDGNPQPRLFRLPEQQAVVNRMGFNNHGIDAVLRNIEKSAYRGILGINIGKNAVTPIENAADDYLICLEKAYAHADYITVNISSPNTKNLRALQGGDELTALLTALKDKQAQLAASHGRYVPTSPMWCKTLKWTASSPPTPPSTKQPWATIRSPKNKAASAACRCAKKAISSCAVWPKYWAAPSPSSA